MVDMNLAKAAGLSDVLKVLSWGAARYGERILDQEANGILKTIIYSGHDESNKKRLIGEFVFDELHTHEDFGGPSNTSFQEFAEGNETKPYRLSKKSNKDDLLSAKKLYNAWAKENGMAGINLDSTFGKDVVTAFNNYNADKSNLRKIQPNGYEFYDSGLGSTAYMVDKLGLTQILPDLKLKPAHAITGFDKAGKAIYADDNHKINTVYDPASKTVRVLDNNFLAERYPAWNGQATTMEPSTTNAGSADQTDEQRAKAFIRNSNIRNGINLAEGLMGGLLATTQIPKWGPTAEYEQMKGEVIARKNQGFTPEEQASINQQLTNNYAAGVAAIRNVAGNGGNQGSVLAALGGINSNLQNSYLQSAVQGAALARDNYRNYQNMVMTDMDIDRQMFQQDWANALETKSNGLAMIQDANQKIFEESMYRDSYGPDSLYNEYLESQREKQANFADITDRQNKAFLNYLADNTGIGTPSTVTPSVVPTIPSFNPLASRFGSINVVSPL